jgi:hypothetical protein
LTEPLKARIAMVPPPVTTGRFLSLATEVPLSRGFFVPGAPTTQPTFTLKGDATDIDDQSGHNNQKHNCGSDRPPIIFGVPWVGPPTVVARPTARFKVSIYHRKQTC